MSRWVTLIGIAISLALLVYLGLSFDLAASVATLSAADPSWLIAAALLYVSLFPLRGLRWAMILRRAHPVSARTATEVFAIGFLANNVMPARLGDVARAFVLARRSEGRAAGLRATTTFTTVLLERVFDGLTVVGMLLLVLWLAPPPQGSLLVQGMAALMAAAFPAAVAAAALVAWNEQRALALARWLLKPLPRGIAQRVERMLGKLAAGLHTLRSAKDTLGVIALSILIWSIEVGVYVLAERALGLSLPFEAMVVVMAVLTLGLTMPSAPAFVGVFEGLVIAAIGLYGVSGPTALAFAAAMHVIHFVPGTALGALCAARMGLRMREIRGSAGDPEEPRSEVAVAES